MEFAFYQIQNDYRQKKRLNSPEKIKMPLIQLIKF